MNKKQVHPEWATCHRKKGTELRKINGRYYLYEYKTVYDKKRKKPKKITGKILGAITEREGFKPSPKRLSEEAPKPITQIQSKEYGMANLITSKFKEYYDALEKIFGAQAKQLLAIAYCRFAYQCRLKHIPELLEASYLPEMLKINVFSEKKVSKILNDLGKNREKILDYMKLFITPNDHILIDFTNIFSNSKHIDLAQYDPQINLLYIYSAKNKTPVYYKLLPGNIREVRAFKNSILEAGLKNARIIADKGFHSTKNVELLEKEGLEFILPLRRNNSTIDYTKIVKNSFHDKATYFKYQKRFIWCEKQKIGENKFLYLFLDEKLKGYEQQTYLSRIDTHPESYNLENFRKTKHRHGTIALLSNVDETEENIYKTYKSRMSIESLFDDMKNGLKIDHTYMQNEQTLKGWMFINHIILQWYQQLYIELKEKKMLGKISVSDCIKKLTNIKKIKINNEWYLDDCTLKTQRLMKKLGIDLHNT